MSITRLTQDYIISHPSVDEGLRRGIINYSALAREIADHYSIEQIDAVAIACRRYAQRNRVSKPIQQECTELLRRARLSVKTRLGMVTVPTPTDWKLLPHLREVLQIRNYQLTILEGTVSTRLVSDTDALPVIESTLRGKLAIKHSESKMAQLVLTLESSATTLDSFVGYVLSLLRRSRVTVVEANASLSEVMVILRELDLPAALATLNSQ